MTITDKQTGMTITGHAGQSVEKLKSELAYRVAMLKDHEPWLRKEKGSARLYDPLYGLVLEEDEDGDPVNEGRKSKRERRFDRRVRP